jgi:GNAT superfamily N-acetyltransferase
LATDADRDAIVGLARSSLGWEEGDRPAAFFSWKHDENPFGPSPMWVAEDDDDLVGFRTFLRWEFVDPDGAERRAVRAVDTATHPDHQGKGIFTRLTLGAIDALRAEGVDFVFNTPNDKSRPGYLKMGWEQLGRVPIGVRPSGPTAMVAMARSREPAEKWSQPTTAGVDAREAFADPASVSAALEAARPVDGHPGARRTRRTPAFLRWRYGFEPLHYRICHLGSSIADGFAVFRLRRRGAATEAALCELVAPDRSRARRLVRAVAQAAGADYVIAAGRPPGTMPLPGQGPILTWREVGQVTRPPLKHWDLVLGDIELF